MAERMDEVLDQFRQFGLEVEATVLFGFFKDFTLSISGPSLSDGTLTVEGLV